MSCVDFKIPAEWIEEFVPYLEPGSSDFLRRVYSGDLGRYQRRLQQYGLTSKKHVLDAGCGFGQWALAFATLGVPVTAVDIQPDRLMVLQELVKRLKLKNLTVQRSSLDSLPFESDRFDQVFCYGAVYLTPWRQSVRELARVIRQGGSMYVNANGFGYYLYAWERNPNNGPGHNPARSAGLAMMNTCDYEKAGQYSGSGPLIIEPGDLADAITQAGMTVIAAGAEGTLVQGSDSILEKPFFPGTYENRVAVHELLATKL